jgi:hypothetical protein
MTSFVRDPLTIIKILRARAKGAREYPIASVILILRRTSAHLNQRRSRSHARWPDDP